MENNQDKDLQVYYENKLNYLKEHKDQRTNNKNIKFKNVSCNSTNKSSIYNSESNLKQSLFLNIPIEVSLENELNEEENCDKTDIENKQLINLNSYIKDSTNYYSQKVKLYDKAMESLSNKSKSIIQSKIQNERKELSLCTFQPRNYTINYEDSSIINKNQTCNDNFLNTYNKNCNWKNKIEEKIESNRKLIEKQSLNECSFQPKISNKTFKNSDKPRSCTKPVNNKVESYRQLFTNTSLGFNKRRESYMNFHNLHMNDLHKKYTFSFNKYQKEFLDKKKSMKAFVKYESIKTKIDNENLTKNKILIKKLDKFALDYKNSAVETEIDNTSKLIESIFMIIEENDSINLNYKND